MIYSLFYYELTTNLSGWQDSNLRPPAPKAGAITELRYTPCKRVQIYNFFSLNQNYFLDKRKNNMKI